MHINETDGLPPLRNKTPEEVEQGRKDIVSIVESIRIGRLMDIVKIDQEIARLEKEKAYLLELIDPID